jgi:hypothetical protein
MPAASLLPTTIHNGKLYFLMGKENPMEDSAKGFSDFGGGKEGQSFYDTALREAAEELTGFLGAPKKLGALVRKNGGTYSFRYQPNTDKEYRVHLFYLDYDPHLVEHFNNNHRYLWERMDKKMLNDSKLFEKIEIRWICETECMKHKSIYRPFFVDILKQMMGELEPIRAFIKKQQIRHQRPCVCGRRKQTRKSRNKRAKTVKRGG